MRARRAAGVIGVIAVLLAGTVGPAFATDPEPSSDYSGGGEDSGGGSTSGVHGACYVTSSASYLGAVCPSGESGGLTNIKDLLAGEKFLKCWWEPMDQGQIEAHNLPDPDSANGGAWFLRRCIDGIDEKTLDVTGQIKTYETGQYEIKHPGKEVIETLGPNETKLVTRYQGQIPYPAPTTTPSPFVRVGKWLAFSDGYRTPQATATQNVVSVQALGFNMVAKETYITVEPLGAGKAPKLKCDGFGTLANPGDKPAKGGCWFRFLRSSASQPKGRYPIRITAHWEVTLEDADGTVTPFNNFDKSQTIYRSVSEIQTVNVPDDQS